MLREAILPTFDMTSGNCCQMADVAEAKKALAEQEAELEAAQRTAEEQAAATKAVPEQPAAQRQAAEESDAGE